MIYDANRLPSSSRLRADLCVVGCGAGGGMAATVAAEAGLRVLVLEPGELVTPADMNQREEVMFKRLLLHGGGQTTTDRGVKIHQGKGVGGSTLHNLNLCKRIPEALLRRWQREGHLGHLGLADWADLYAEVESLLHVSEVPPERWNAHNRLLQAGCDTLGWQGGGLSHNRTGCVGSGFCELGCAYDAKNNVAKVLLPRLMAAGGEIVTSAQVVRVIHRNGRITGVEARVLDPMTHEAAGTLEVQCDRVCVSASATGTPAVLARSELGHADEHCGRSLHVHPAVVAAGEFQEPVRAWSGIPQTYECTQWLGFDAPEDPRVWIVPAFAHPMATAAMLPGWGRAHRDRMEHYDRIAVFTAMVHDEAQGTVTPEGELGHRIEYWPNARDRRELKRGLVHMAELLFAAGAQRVVIPTDPMRILLPGDRDGLRALDELELEPGALDIVSVHPMGSVPMDDDPTRAVLDSNGKHHTIDGLWVADGSVFPSSIGVPPQLSIYAMGLHVGRAIVAATG